MLTWGVITDQRIVQKSYLPGALIQCFSSQQHITVTWGSIEKMPCQVPTLDHTMRIPTVRIWASVFFKITEVALICSKGWDQQSKSQGRAGRGVQIYVLGEERVSPGWSWQWRKRSTFPREVMLGKRVTEGETLQLHLKGQEEVDQIRQKWCGGVHSMPRNQPVPRHGGMTHGGHPGAT